MRFALVDFGHPFYRPMTRRVIIFVLLLVWTGVEFLSGSTGWMVFFIALSAYVSWGFFLSGQVDGSGQETTEIASDRPSDDSK